jgi:non-lysosomal glucosylceramidase
MFVSTHCFIILCDDGAGTAALTRGQQAFDSQQWVSNSTASHYSFSVESPDSLMADTLYAQLLADSVGLGSLIDEEKMKTHLETEALWNDSPYGLRVESNAGVSSGSGEAVWQVRKTALLSHLYIKCIILPRQARDKHRENSKKGRFLQGASPNWASINIRHGFMGVEEALAQPEKSLGLWRDGLHDLWNICGLSQNGQSWITSHYGTSCGPN